MAQVAMVDLTDSLGATAAQAETPATAEQAEAPATAAQAEEKVKVVKEAKNLPLSSALQAAIGRKSVAHKLSLQT